MKVNISNIVKIDGASLNIEFNEKIDGLKAVTGDEFVFTSPVSFDGSIVNTGGLLRLEGQLKAEYTVKCYKCLRDVEDKLTVGLKESFVDADKAEKDIGTETYTYEGSFIDIDRVLIDNIVLNLPMKKACTAECKGICPKCGTDLNDGQCGCKEDGINPRMEILKNFFKS